MDVTNDHVDLIALWNSRIGPENWSLLAIGNIRSKACAATIFLIAQHCSAARVSHLQAARGRSCKENQQDRIGQGVKSGQLTSRETAHLENREANVHREVRNDRAANGGKLTGQERRQVNRQQNRTSRAIYRDKHNGRKQ